MIHHCKLYSLKDIAFIRNDVLLLQSTYLSFAGCKVEIFFKNEHTQISQIIQFTIHQRNLQILATEIFKVKNSLAPEIMTEVFEIKEPHYNMRSEASHFKRENVKSNNYGI